MTPRRSGFILLVSGVVLGQLLHGHLPGWSVVLIVTLYGVAFLGLFLVAQRQNRTTPHH